MITTTAFEAQGCRALARLGGRMTLVYTFATVLGLVSGAGTRAGPAAAEVLALGCLAAPATVAAGLLLPSAHGRHVASAVAWAPRSRTLRRALPWLLVSLATACGALAVQQVTGLAPQLGSARVHALAGWLLPGYGLGLTLATGPARGLAAFTVLVAALRATVSQSAASAVPVTAVGAAVTVVVGVAIQLTARQGFRATEVAARAAEDAERARVAAEQRLLDRRRTDRTLHDTVLATLTLLAHAGVGVAPAAVRSACRRDLALLRGTVTFDGDDPGADQDSLPAPADGLRSGQQGAAAGRIAPSYVVGRLGEVRELAARRGLDLRVHVQSDAQEVARPGQGRPVLDPASLRAWSGALTECVSNIARHAEVAVADVVIGLTDDALVTVVVDEGVGFEPAAVPAERLGLTGSVHERLVEVGGRAQVWSRPGQGTVVELLLPWPRPTTGRRVAPVGLAPVGLAPAGVGGAA